VWIACAVAAALAIPCAWVHADVRADRAARDAAQKLCETQDPSCDWLATLSSLERASVTRGLAARGLTIEPAPWGKTVGKIYIYNEDVFAEGSKVLRFFNRLHYTTQESTIRADLVLQEGELWTTERTMETARRLRDPSFSSVVVLLPVQTAVAGQVDVFVVTRDIWSLRLNTQYTFQEGKLTNLSMSISENNFLGTRAIAALAVTMDQGAIATGPLYVDKNLFGKYIELRARVDAVLNRDDLFDGDWNREGSQSTVSVSRQLWSLASKWGAGMSFSHRYAIDRSFRGTSLRTVHCPEGGQCEVNFEPDLVDDSEELPFIYRMKRWGVSAYGTRQWGESVKHQLSLSYGVSSQRPELLSSFPGTEAQAAAFIDAVFPRSELASVASIGYGFFTPTFNTLRNISTFDLAEDVRFGPDFDVSLGIGTKVLGGDNNFQRASASGGWTFPWGRDGFWRLGASISTRRQSGDFIDNSAGGSVRITTPTLGYGRIVALTSLSTLWDNTQNTFFTVGSDDGLRGFSINEFAGQRLLKVNLEARSLPFPFWVFRVGGVLFYDGAAAADTLREMHYYQNVGVGFRLLVPQTSRELFRFDLAFPLDTTNRTTAGHPRFLAGFESAF